MDDQATPDEAGGGSFFQRHAIQMKRDLGVPPSIGFECRQVSGMVGRFLRAMWCPRRVEMPAGAQAIATGTVTFLVDMKTVLLPRLEPTHHSGDDDMVTMLHKLHRPLHGLATSRRKRRMGLSGRHHPSCTTRQARRHQCHGNTQAK